MYLRKGPNLQKLLLLLLLLNAVAAVSGYSVSGFLGEQVVLPCTYKGNVPVSDLQVIWWIFGNGVLHKFVNGNDDLTLQAPQFRDRTNLFKDQLEQGNWSLLISDLRQSDQNEYRCEIQQRETPVFHQDVDLSVTERTRTPVLNTSVLNTPVLNTPVPDPGLSTGAVVGLVIAILLLLIAVIVVFVIQKRQRWNCVQNRHRIKQNEASNVPLTGVTCSGETRDLVTTAPEHQNGAAGEQNLLGNGAVQH
ncbi:myelin-oligodendrocyte glycoprotein-like isoform X2 [Heterodontus francisci]|uniref:myelin-oligodendrocyte glycoprotein-like isoform X2 n=1 Tax=Heterodontus francisci TaxID=7792 RepID=UPI00355BC759